MSFRKTREIMAARRASAEKRQEAYNKLTLEQKFAKLPAEPAGAKVRAKLNKQLEASKKPKPTVQEVLVKQTAVREEIFNEIKKPKKSKKEGK